MLHSKFSSESLPQRKKPTRLRSYLILLLMIFIIGASYLSYHNYQRIVFRFKKDRYASIINNINEFQTSIKSNPEKGAKLSDATEELLTNLIKDNPADSYLYYLYGKLFTIESLDLILDNPEKLTEIFFLDYIKHYHFPSGTDENKWEKGILYTRKALLLGLQEKDAELAKLNLLKLYLIGGTSYWISAREYLGSQQGVLDSLVQNLYKLIFTDSPPDWLEISQKYGEDITTFWSALFNLKIKNYPVAFFYLKKLLISDSVYLRNNAYYIMGYIMSEQRDMNAKMYYHSLIDFDEFLRRNPWFLEEHNYTLRFMGQNVLAKNFLSQFEKLVLELKE